MSYSFKAVNTAFLLLIIFLISSCSTLPGVVDVQPGAWQNSVLQKNKIKRWDVKGRLGIQTEYEGGSFDFFWSQTNADYTIRLIAPFGQGAFYIEGDTNVVSIRNARGKTLLNRKPELLFKEQLGIDLPLGSLRQWMLGIPDARLKIKSILWDEQGRLSQLEQAGWNIEMSRYKLVGDIRLPHYFILQRENRPELSVRLIIRQWSFDD